MENLVKKKSIFVYSLFCLQIPVRRISQTLYIKARVCSLARSKALSMYFNVCVCDSKAWCMEATRRMHALHRIAVCVVKGVWNSCCETQIISALPRKPLVRQQRSQHNATLLIFSHLYCLHLKCGDI